jgi:hypothetical protein
MKDYVLANTGKDFEAWLADTGQTEEDVMNQVSRHLLTAKLVLTTEDREAYFEAHKDELRELPHNSESVIFRQIVVGSEEEADAIYAELTSGDAADFAAVAEERSIDPMTRARGGMTGWLIRGKTDDPELEDTLFTLEPGQVSRPLPVQMPTPESEDEEDAQPAPRFWRIVKVEKLLPAREVTLEDNLDIIEDRMLSEPQFQMQLNQFLSNLRARADVEVVSPRYTVVDELYRREREAREQRLSASGAVMPGSAPIAPEPAGPESSPSGTEGARAGAATE